MRFFQLFICVLIGAFFIQLSGCGGGGGGGGDSATSGKLVGPEGGTLDFGSGLVVEIPSGAVSTEITLKAQLLDPSDSQSVLNESGNGHRRFAAGVSLEPSGLKFNTPITVTLPLHEKPTGDALPIHYLYDPDYQAYYPAPTYVSVSSENNTVTLTLNEFSDHVLAWIANVFKSTCPAEDPCRCGNFTVKEESRDQTYSESDCQAIDIHGSIIYHDCGPGGITESWLMTEHSSGCVPIMKLTAERNLLGPEETTSIYAKVTYLEEPVSGLTVKMSSNNLITLDSTSVVTGEDGIAKTIVTTGTREGVAPVNAEASQLFASTIIAANGVEQETVERLKEMTAKTYITVDVPSGLVIDILPGRNNSFLTYNESTTVEVSALDFSNSADEDSFQFIPGVVVDLQTTAGNLAPTQVSTSSSGPVSVVLTAPDVSGPVTVSGSAIVETLTENGDPVSYGVTSEDTIDVQPLSDWVGTIKMDYSGCSGWSDPELTNCVGYQYSFTADVDFSLDVDENNSSPSPSNPNVSGTGTVLISNVNTIEGPLRFGSYFACDNAAFQEYVHEVHKYPFAMTIEGIRLENSFGTSNDLWMLFQHPTGGSDGMILVFDVGEREYCNGILTNTVISRELGGILWNPAIVVDWDPIVSDDPGFRLDLAGRTTVTKTGECGSGRSGEYIGAGEGCTYTLTMTKVQ